MSLLVTGWVAVAVVLVVAGSSWVLDSRITFHICPQRD
jgi:hypothetical protein